MSGLAIYIFPPVYKCSPFLHMLTNTCCLFIFDDSSNGGEVIFYFDFDWITKFCSYPKLIILIVIL